MSDVELKRADFAFIGSVAELEEPAGSGDFSCLAAPLGAALGMPRMGINHETVPPGCRTALPHAHRTDDEFVYVIDGTPDLWIDGRITRLKPGDAAAFPAGTGIAHTFINNSDAAVKLLIIGAGAEDDQVSYPADPDWRHPQHPWDDPPKRPLGPHDGKPDNPKTD